MTSLHIEHTVTDLDQWLESLSSFDEVRVQGGVTAMHVRHSIDDPNHVAVDLEFGTADEARSYREFLETQVWPNSSHLGGEIPETRLLEPVRRIP